MGCSFEDPVTPGRHWVIDGVYAPVPGRALGGIRARVSDQKSFLSFVNQQDLELLLGLAESGRYCPWTGKPYPYVNDEGSGWVGLLVDDDDLSDDLFEKEMVLREQYGWRVLPQIDIYRRVHRMNRRDVERRDLLLWDADPQTGLGPDPRFESIGSRWSKVEEERVTWEHLQ